LQQPRRIFMQCGTRYNNIEIPSRRCLAGQSTLLKRRACWGCPTGGGIGAWCECAGRVFCSRQAETSRSAKPPLGGDGETAAMLSPRSKCPRQGAPAPYKLERRCRPRWVVSSAATDTASSASFQRPQAKESVRHVPSHRGTARRLPAAQKA
jgi:hypothetical protein